MAQGDQQAHRSNRAPAVSTTNGALRFEWSLPVFRKRATDGRVIVKAGRKPLVVVPVDSSSDEDVVIAYALALAQRRQADVDLLTIVRARGPSVLDAPDIAVFGQMSSSLTTTGMPAPTRVEDLTATTGANSPHVRQVTYRGDAAPTIAAYAQLAMAAVIVVGKHYGSPRWRRSATVVSTLGRSASVPVLVVPPRPEGDAPPRTGPFTNIVSAIDFTVSSAVAMRTALDLARASGGRVTLVHALKNVSGRMVFSGGEAANAIDEAHADAVNVATRLRQEIPGPLAERVEPRVTTGDPSRGILDVASEVNADLIVMGVPPRGRMDEVLFGSTLRGVLRRATLPVLVLPVVAGGHEWLVGATP